MQKIHYLAPLQKVNGVDNPVLALVNGIRLSSLSPTGDYAGNKPSNIVRVGTTTDGSQGKQIALSSDSGSTWYVSHQASLQARP